MIDEVTPEKIVDTIKTATGLKNICFSVDTGKNTLYIIVKDDKALQSDLVNSKINVVLSQLESEFDEIIFTSQ
jgi:hypothetical protein